MNRKTAVKISPYLNIEHKILKFPIKVRQNEKTVEKLEYAKAFVQENMRDNSVILCLKNTQIIIYAQTFVRED